VWKEWRRMGSCCRNQDLNRVPSKLQVRSISISVSLLSFTSYIKEFLCKFRFAYHYCEPFAYHGSICVTMHRLVDSGTGCPPSGSTDVIYGTYDKLECCSEWGNWLDVDTDKKFNEASSGWERGQMYPAIYRNETQASVCSNQSEDESTGNVTQARRWRSIIHNSLKELKTKKLNSMAWVRERTIPTEVGADFCG
jgi:hypothetical protein